MKKKIAALSAMILCMAMVVSGTMAYFTQDDTAVNVITTGGIKIELKEWRNEERTEEFKNLEGVMPGEKVTKIVTVENKEQPAYIRARYEITVTDRSGDIMQIPATVLKDVVKIDVNEGVNGYWTWHQPDSQKPGWYYYNVAVGTGAVTEPLFTHVELDGDSMNNDYQGCAVAVNVYTEAVQQANNPAEAGKTYLALGWDE